MKFRALILFVSAAVLIISCDPAGGGQTDDQAGDSAKIPDSVPQMVRMGKEGTWAYKPDTAIYDVVLGNAASFKAFTPENGNNGTTIGDRRSMSYFNSIETEYFTVYTISVNGNNYPYLLRLSKNSDSLGNNKRPHNYCTVRNFITGHGIYMGMTEDYVQTIYKGQPMMRWIKNDTTYLAYAPSDKDKEYYIRYPHADYSAVYKFVDQRLCVIEMTVDPEAFESK